jgi:hypothetical protein
LLEERVDEEPLHGVQMGDDLLVTTLGIGSDRREFEPIERALAGEGFALALAIAIEPERIFLADEDSHEWIEAKLIVIVEIFIAQTEAEDSLLEEIDERVLDAIGIAMIGEAAGELLNDSESLLDFAEQEPAAIGRDFSSIERRGNLARMERLEFEMALCKLCHDETAPSLSAKVVW